MTTYANPGAVGDVVTATAIETTWGNAIRDRVIQNFASAAARDAAITSPVVGMHCYVTSVGLMQYSGATNGWTQPWYQPWGMVYFAQLTSGDFTSLVNAEANVVTLGSQQYLKNRAYEIRANVEAACSTATRILSRIENLTDVIRSQIVDTIPAAGTFSHYSGLYSWRPSVTASKEFRITAQNAGGSGTFTIHGSSTAIGAIIAAFDCGPTGDPS